MAALRESGPDATVLGVMREDFPTVHPWTPFDEAFRMMRKLAMDRNRQLVEIAQQIIDIAEMGA